MTARHNPQHVIIVQRDIPLDIAGGVCHQVRLQTVQGRLFHGVNVAVPVRVTVVAYWAAHDL